MEGSFAKSAASDMSGLNSAEERAWRNFLDSALRLHAALNRGLTEAHNLTLLDVRLLDLLDTSATGALRMGDLAEELMSLPSRVTRQISRLERQGLVRRTASPDDGRGVLAAITEVGRNEVRKAMFTYGDAVRTYFVGQLSRAQLATMGENCRRISSALKADGAPGAVGRV